jgi:hypothetical protein
MMNFIEDAAIILVIGGFILGLGIGYYVTSHFVDQSCNRDRAAISSHPLV